MGKTGEGRGDAVDVRMAVDEGTLAGGEVHGGTFSFRMVIAGELWPDAPGVKSSNWVGGGNLLL